MLAIDITTNPEALQQKLNKQRQLTKLCQNIGIDRTAVCLVNTKGETNLKAMLKSIIRGEKLIELAA